MKNLNLFVLLFALTISLFSSCTVDDAAEVASINELVTDGGSYSFDGVSDKNETVNCQVFIKKGQTKEQFIIENFANQHIELECTLSGSSFDANDVEVNGFVICDIEGTIDNHGQTIFVKYTIDDGDEKETFNVTMGKGQALSK